LSRRWLSRVILRLVPRAWRDTVGADLDEEARTSRRGRLWFWTQSLAAAVRLRRFSFGDTLRTDITYAVRSLARSPGYTTAAVLTFTLGIGANIAVFSVIDRMMFRPLPYGDADGLVHLHSFVQSEAYPEAFLLEGHAIALRERARSFDDIATARTVDQPVSIDGLGDDLILSHATHNLLEVLRVSPVAGRDFSAADIGGVERPILLAYAEWERRFDRSRDVFERTLSAGTGTRRQRYRVVGVLPPGFLVPSSGRTEHIDGLVLTTAPFVGDLDFFEMGPSAVARLRNQVSRDEAQAEVEALVARVALEFPDAALAGRAIHVEPVREGLFLLYRPYAWLIVAGVGLVLLLACANLATLLLAKGRSRETDVAIRTALGASPWRVGRLILIEATGLCVMSAGIALAVCQTLSSLVLSLVPAGLRGVAASPLDGRLIALATATAIASAVVAALLPTWHSLRNPVLGCLRQDGRSLAGSLRGGATLMAIEATLGVLLVAGAVTTVVNFAQMAYGFQGFDENDLYALRVRHGYVRIEGERRHDPGRLTRIAETVRAVPAVRDAGTASRVTLGMERNAGDRFWRDLGQDGHVLGVGDRYFSTAGIPLVVGREFVADEIEDRAPVALVNRQAAAQLWPAVRVGEVPGRFVQVGTQPRRVVGVVHDVRTPPGEAPSAGLYLPMTAPDAPANNTSVEVLIRMHAGIAPDVAAIGARLDEAFGPDRVTLESIAERTTPYLQRPRFQAVLFASIAVIALVLASVGLYALAAFDVARRRREMGIRLALGATARDLRRAVIGVAVRPVILGAAAGLILTWWAAQFLQAFLFEVDARDPWTFALVALVLVATAVLAAWLPARRAARTDPASVLRAI